jgi:hypothetical protein
MKLWFEDWNVNVRHFWLRDLRGACAYETNRLVATRQRGDSAAQRF